MGDNYEENICEIIDIDYPTELPTQNNTINWEPIIEKLEECDILDYKIQTKTSVSLPESNKLNEHYILPPVKELELYVKSKRKYTNNAQTLMKVGNEIIKRV